jgi:hypothetical protein
MAIKTIPTKKIKDLNTAITNTFGFLTLGLICVWAVILFSIYSVGFWVGISCLFGRVIGDSFYKKILKDKVINPFDHAYGPYGSSTYQKDREFYEQVNNYMRKTKPKNEFSKIVLAPYILLIVFTILFWGGVGFAFPIPIVITISLLNFFFSIFGGLQPIVNLWQASTPHKISEFFGVPMSKWKADFKPVKRPPSVTGITLLFFGLGFSGMILAPTSLIGKMLNIRLIFPLENTAMLVSLSVGAALIGGFCLWAGFGLKKMTKEGAGGAVMLCFFPLFLGVIAFIVAPLAGQTPVPIYHSLWVFGIPIGVIYIIKRNWSKFKG